MPVYIDSNNISGTYDGLSWATAFQGCALAIADATYPVAVDDTVWLASNHIDPVTGSILFPNGCNIYSVNSGTDVYERGALIQNTSAYTYHRPAAGGTLTWNGIFIDALQHLYISNTNSRVFYNDCYIYAVKNIYINSDGAYLSIKDCEYKSGYAGSGFIVAGGGVVEIDNLIAHATHTTTADTRLFSIAGGGGGFGTLVNTDVSAILGAGVNLMLISNINADTVILTVRNCKYPTGSTAITGVGTNPNLKVSEIACDVGDGYHYFRYTNEEGTSSQDTTTYTNNTEALPVPYSVSMDGTNNSIGNPLRHKLATIPAQNLAESKTFTISLIADTTALTDTNFFVEAVHPDNTTQALGVTVSTRNADILADGDDLTTDTTTSWTGGFGANNVPQKVSIAVPALSNVTDGTVELYVNLCNPVSCFVNPVYGVT